MKDDLTFHIKADVPPLPRIVLTDSQAKALESLGATVKGFGLMFTGLENGYIRYAADVAAREEAYRLRMEEEVRIFANTVGGPVGICAFLMSLGGEDTPERRAWRKRELRYICQRARLYQRVSRKHGPKHSHRRSGRRH